MRKVVFLLLLFPFAVLGADGTRLPGTASLSSVDDRSAAMVEGIGTWLERATQEMRGQRIAAWKTGLAGNGESFLAEKRERLRAILGLVDPRVAPHLEEISTPGKAAAEGGAGSYSIHQVRWNVFDGVHGEGLLLRPRGEARALVLALPDADQLPEMMEEAHRAATAGALVLVPVLVDRGEKWSGSESLQRFTNQPHREWVYRQAFEVGRTLIGYEVAKIIAGIDALLKQQQSHQPQPSNGLSPPVGIVGRGEGGLLALHCAALDPRLRAVMVRGYFAPREGLFAEPIYRNLFGLLRDFGDAELAALVAPRSLMVDQSGWPNVSGPPAPGSGRTGAAPGSIHARGAEEVSEEVKRANELRRLVANAAPVEALPGATQNNNGDAVRRFLDTLDLRAGDSATNAGKEPDKAFTDARQRRAVRELERFTQSLVRSAEQQRDERFWKNLQKANAREKVQHDTRAELWERAIGKLPAASLPPNARTRRIVERPKWIGYEVVLDVFPEVFAWGWLLVPREIKEGERRPVVVCQHGLEGLPEDVVNEDPASRAYAAYKGYAAKLADRGFVVYAPHNPYRGGDKFRVLQRRANPLGLSLFSFIIAQHAVTTDWLATLPFVDPKRIAFYGLSYGGKTAMRVPALLDRYCLSICSADFNEWIFKNVTVDARFSYMFTGEYEMPEWNLANVANYAEMAMLIAPRPFMVERGHDDGVGLDEWVAYEYAKVRRGYTKLGIGDRTEIEWFDGPHTINGIGTFEFLHKHLAWPK